MRPREGCNLEKSHREAVAVLRSLEIWPVISHGAQHSVSTQHQPHDKDPLTRKDRHRPQIPEELADSS